MYNFITNDWKDAPHQLTFDVRQPKTRVFVKEKLKRWCEENPQVDVVRFTTSQISIIQWIRIILSWKILKAA